ncbi:MAG: hypothetical protein JWQ85_1997 [Mucilaginibacter sp.]|nr:hypothetical protein [Mucilaginibacter sp.]
MFQYAIRRYKFDRYVLFNEKVTIIENASKEFIVRVLDNLKDVK